MSAQDGRPTPERAELESRIASDVRAMTAESDRLGRVFGAQHSLSANDFRALLHIMVADVGGRPVSPGELGSVLGLSSAAMTYLVERMIDLARRRIDMEAVVAPAISATVGVATAFVVNPIVGAAVFAASQVLGPLWSKISLIRYHIGGDLDQPKINEVQRKSKEDKAS